MSNEAVIRRLEEEFAQFAHIASHNLKEPLREIYIFTEKLQRELAAGDPASANASIGRVLSGARRMNEMLDDLFRYSQIDSPGSQPVALDLNVLVNEVLFNLNGRIQSAGAKLTREPLPPIFGDRLQWMQLFEHLIDNALTFRSEQTPEISIRGSVDGDVTRFSIQDNGIGVDPAYHSTIFKLFKRLHSRERYPGNGVGLAICERIVKRHGGRIWIESRPAEGSTFHIEVPQRRS